MEQLFAKYRKYFVNVHYSRGLMLLKKNIKYVIILLSVKYGVNIMAKILVTMPDEFLHKIDGVALNEQRSRSELIREALRTYMRRTNIRNTQKADEDARFLENLIG